MASLKLENGEVLTDLDDIQKCLSPLGINLSSWLVNPSQETAALLEKPALDDSEKELILDGIDHYFEKLKSEKGYTSRDLIVLHDALPGLDGLLEKFKPCHTHDDDEVRYIIDGEGVFGFVLPDGKQVELKVQAEEFINVPANTEHWFRLTASKRIKAVRYFAGTEGWVPVYTDTHVRF